MTVTRWNVGFFGLALGAIVLLCASRSASAGGWSDRVGHLNSREITPEEAARTSKGEDQDRRNKISVRRLRPAQPDVDWNADPTAVPYMLYQVNKRTDLPVYINNDGVDAGKDDVFEHTVIYLTSHKRWSLNEKEVVNMTLFLARGGTLWLDDCYLRGSPFSDSVRPEVAKLIPGAEPILLLKEDPKVRDMFKMIYPTPWPGAAEFENRPWQYFVQNGRPAVFFSPNDDGCGWEVSTPPSASNPIGEGIGHGGDNRQRETMYQWSTNFLMFAYTH